MADAESSQSPGLVLVAITCLGSISWPLLVARWALDFAYHGKHLGPPTVMEVGPLVAVSSALIALAMWRRNRLTVESLVKAGAFGGFCIGALLMCLGELRRVGGQLDPGPRAWLAIRAFVGGAVGGADLHRRGRTLWPDNMVGLEGRGGCWPRLAGWAERSAHGRCGRRRLGAVDRDLGIHEWMNGLWNPSPLRLPSSGTEAPFPVGNGFPVYGPHAMRLLNEPRTCCRRVRGT